ncbi:OLC1v1002007C2 [Oldenlandia corymbosa var. corymbosa]|uniref:OLC1v1002007C2 n=1 Tax=Oldenlandia corymbosa var. corymbosa TaxID=529605 RepID=A0AAV1D6M1_OLDCO|nr:OLC1v1002007C2 [Oldenlandia corymbosa var. corymbosa]
MAEVAAGERKGRKILVAVDEGEESGYALRWCLNNIVNQDSKDALVLLFAKPPRPVYSALDGSGYLFSADILETMERYSNEVADQVMEKAKNSCAGLNDDVSLSSSSFLSFLGGELGNFVDELNELELIWEFVLSPRNCGVQIKVETKVVNGDPRDVICQVAERLNVDLVVMGSHGYGLIKRAFLGSVSNHCAQNLKCPVLIVKKPKSHD